MTTPPSNHERLGEAILCTAAAVFIWLLQFKFPATPFFLENDQLIFIYEGWRMSLGDVIYRDLFQFTFPGTQSVYAVLIFLFGSKFVILNATVVVLGAAHCYLLVRIAKRVIDGPLAYLPAVVFVFFGMRWFGLDGSHRMFSPLFVLAAVLVALVAKKVSRFVLAGGLCGAASFFTQQRGLVAAVGLCIFIMADGWFGSPKWELTAKKMLAVAVGFASALAVLCLPFIIAAGPKNFFASTILYPQRYYAYDPNNRFAVVLHDIAAVQNIGSISDAIYSAAILMYLLVLPLACVAFLIAMLAKKPKWAEIRNIVLVAVVGAALIFTTIAPLSSRLFGVSGLALVVLFWLVRSGLKDLARSRIAIAALILPLLLLGASQVYRLQTSSGHVMLSTPTGTLAASSSPQTGRYVFLSENTSPGEPFFEVYEPFIYFPLQLRNPTRYGQIWQTDYTRPEHVAEVVKDLSASKPKFLLWDNGYDLPPEDRQPGDHTGPLAEFVKHNYRPLGPIYDINGRPIQIWERSGQ